MSMVCWFEQWVTEARLVGVCSQVPVVYRIGSCALAFFLGKDKYGMGGVVLQSRYEHPNCRHKS